LSCNNLTLGQYRIIVLTRGLSGAAGFVISLAVLGIVLLTTKKKAWENLPKRVYLASVLYTLLYCVMAIVAVNYSHPPSQESAWCEAMGFLLHYTGTLVIVHYCAFVLTVVFQVTLPVYQAIIGKRHDDIHGPRKVKLWREVTLFLILFLFPILNTWEPFLPQLPSYGNYGPLCWFRLELTDNCTTNKSDEHFLQAIPLAVVCFGCFVIISTISLVLCRMYCKFRTKTTGSRIIRVIPPLAVMTIITFMVMLWFILSALPFKSLSKVGSFSSWLKNVTVTTASAIGTLVVVGVYVHFPTHLCLHCKRRLHQEGAQGQNGQERGQNGQERGQNGQERGQNGQRVVRHPEVAHQPVTTTLHPPEVQVDHQKYRTHTTYDILHSPVTTEITPLISTHPMAVDHHKYSTHTIFNIPHSPVTTNHTPLISTHPPEFEVDHNKYPTDTTFNIPHSPVTTDHTPLISTHPPEFKVDCHKYPTHTVCMQYFP